MIKNIVVGYDGSAGAQTALAQALDIAEITGGRIHLVTAEEEAESGAEQDMLSQPDVLDILDATDSLEEEAAEGSVAVPDFVEEARLKCQEAHISCTVNVGPGPAARYVREYAWLADLVVVGRGSRPRLRAGEIGRTTRQLLQVAQRPILVAGQEYAKISSVMVVGEKSSGGGRALSLAGELGSELNVPVDVLVAGHPRHVLTRWSTQVRSLLRAYHVQGEVESSEAPLPQALTTWALERSPSVIVLPQVQRQLLSWRLASVCQTALQLPDAMVMVVP